MMGKPILLLCLFFVVGIESFRLPPPTPHLMKSRLVDGVVKFKDINIVLQNDLQKIIQAMVDDFYFHRRKQSHFPQISGKLRKKYPDFDDLENFCAVSGFQLGSRKHYLFSVNDRSLVKL